MRKKLMHNTIDYRTIVDYNEVTRKEGAYEAKILTRDTKKDVLEI